MNVVTSFARKPERTLSAEIPGAVVPNERIVIAAHVQEPGANDNASGAATNMELTRALVTGVLSGRIPKPARTLTFLWVNEISGSRRWLTEHADEKAGVRYMFSMDMTGEDITKTGGHFLVERCADPGAEWARPWDPHTEWGASRVEVATRKGDLINDVHLAMWERGRLKSLAGPGLEVRQILTRGRQQVKEQTNGKQIPWDHSSLTQDYYFLGPTTVVVQPQAAPAAQPKAAGVDPMAVQLSLWESVRTSQDPADFEDYLKQYPDGKFAAIARRRVAALKTASPK